jgi:hypothetical protein
MRRFPPIAVLLLVVVGLHAEPVGIVSRIKRVPVESSAVATVGYSKKLRALEIEFRNGSIYRYLEVPANVYEALLNARSKARYYDENIRHKYRSQHVKSRAE